MERLYATYPSFSSIIIKLRYISLLLFCFQLTLIILNGRGSPQHDLNGQIVVPLHLKKGLSLHLITIGYQIAI